MTQDAGKLHVCPWWLGYFLISPLRRLFNDPAKILGPYVRGGMTVLEIGPGMGFFSLPMAQFVGSQGRVLCVDVQEKMLQKLRSRAAKAGLSERIVTVRATENSLCLGAYEGKADFALAFAVVHEVPDQTVLFSQIYGAMTSGALLLVSEPQGHVTEEQFGKTLEIAKQTGLGLERRLDISKTHSALLKK
jgi:tRNA A58 N-methylase Trm61